MKIKSIVLTFIAAAALSLAGKSQCRDTIAESFSATIPTQAGTWETNSIIFASTTSPNVCASCPRTGTYYAYINGLGDYIRTPLIPNPSNFSFWYRRSSTSATTHRLIVETSPDNINWTTRLTVTSFTATYQQVSLTINNVYVRIRDARTLASDTKVVYVDDISWNWENHVGVWTGTVSSDWQDPLNWCKSQVPTSSDDVTVYPGTPYPCCIFSGIANCRNLTLNSGGPVTVYGGTLRIGGTISSQANLSARAGTVELNGTAQQTIKGSDLALKLLGNLIISNPAGVSMGTNETDTLKLLNSITFTTVNSILTTGGALTLCSSDTLTARIGDLGSNRILGNVTVERFIPNHTKAWQLLGVPTVGQTINQSWQEGNSILGNSRPGYGTIITGPAVGADIYTATPSMKYYNYVSGQWQGVSNTGDQIANQLGYMLFVRGDRSVTAYNQAATATVLRTYGTLYTPTDNPPPTVQVAQDAFQSIGNPYASPIDFSKISITGGVQNAFYLWDPKLTASGVSAYGLGGYQTFVWNGSGYTAVPGGGSYAAGNTNIESGLAFFVKSVGSSGTVSFTESAKSTGSNTVTRINSRQSSIMTRLSVLYNGSPILLDGTLSQFDQAYSNCVDKDDVREIGVGEGISLGREGLHLTAECRERFSTTDTVFFEMNQLRQQTYQLKLTPQNMNSIANSAILVDRFLGTRTQVSLRSESMMQFTITQDPLSYNKDRFYLVLIRSKVEPQPNEKTDIFVWPNPISGGTLNLRMTAPSGKYRINITNNMGRAVYSKEIFHYSEKSLESLILTNKITPGAYRLVISSNSKRTQSINIVLVR